MDPIGLIAYRAATAVAAPAVPLLLRQRAAIGKEDRSRTSERFGVSERARGDGPLVWVHGASVGECMAALPLIHGLQGKAKILITSGTVASAQMMQRHLPPDAVHQFVPVDTPAATQRFLAHWKPDVGLFVDSDLWPNLVLGAKAAGTRLALVNARISERSFNGWRWVPRTAATILSAFDVCLAQDEIFAARFRHLGCRNVIVSGSLKADAPPLDADENDVAATRAAIGDRPVLLAAQTHAGEDETILPAHDMLRRTLPQLLTIIVPRHVERGADIAMLCATRPTKRRSLGEQLAPGTAVYIADTMGELGLFYRLAPLAFVGGTLVPMGGHNPLEPAKLGCAVIAGPHIANSASAFEAIFAAQGMGLVNSAAEIAGVATRLLSSPEEAKAIGEAARRGAATLGGAVAKTITAVEDLIRSHART
jgi:3-deoxy-D-manno-octulosonic-acid transferase